MKKITYIGWLMVLVLAAGGLQANALNGTVPDVDPGSAPDVTFDDLKKGFMGDPPVDCRPQTYLHIFDRSAEVCEEVLRTSRNMMDQGFNAGYPFALGMDFTGTGRRAPAEDWMSDDWFRMMQKLAEQANSRDRKMGFQSDYNWPVFRAGDRVQKKYPELKGGQSLRASRVEVRGGDTVKLPKHLFAVAARIDSTSRLILSENLRLLPPSTVSAGEWRAPAPAETVWRVFCFEPFERPGANYRVDLLNPKVGDAFIELSLEKHKEHLGEFFGRTIDTVWLDHEGDVGWGMIWSQPLFQRFLEKTGRDLREQLPLLLEDDMEGVSARARWEWFDAVSDLYAANWRKITEWAAAHGMTTGSQLWEESLTWQGSCAPDMFKLQRQFSFPCVDALQLKAAKNPEHFKQTQSVAEFENRIMGVEMMALANEKFSPTTLKQCTDGAIAFGELPSGSPEAGFHDPEIQRMMAELQKMPGFSHITGSPAAAIAEGLPGLEPALRVTGRTFPMWTMHKRIDGRDFFWMVNRTEEKQQIVVSGESLRGKVTKWDCETGEILPLGDGDVSGGVPLVFQPKEAFWLVADPQSKATPPFVEPEPEHLLTLDGEWTVSAAAEQPPLVGFVVPESIAQPQLRRLGDWVEWGAGSFSGRIEYTKNVVLNKPHGQSVWLDLGTVNVAASVTINGRPVGERIWAPYRFDITDALKDGKNEIRILVANTLNNYMGKASLSGLFGPVKLTKQGLKTAGESADAHRPNILLIIADDLGTQLGCYGEELSKQED